MTIILVAAAATTVTEARTIELHKEEIDRAAMISSRMPRGTWVGEPEHYSQHTYDASVYLERESAFLIHYDLSAIPENMRITKAQWMMRGYDREPREVRVFVWRMLTSWGPGVCHDYRQTDPEKQAWDEPGGRSPGVDRAMQPTQIVHIDNEEQWVKVNVTQDVSLWHRGVVPNEGWMLTVPDNDAHVQMRSPLSLAENNWRLRITYEPR